MGLRLTETMCCHPDNLIFTGLYKIMCYNTVPIYECKVCGDEIYLEYNLRDKTTEGN